jgi:Protein of unknown function (DUF3485)
MSAVVSRKFVTPLVMAATIAIVSGLAHGWLNDRWVSKPNVDAIAAKLDELPNEFGDWQLVDNQELPDFAQSQLQCYGYKLQVYENTKTGRRLTVAVLFGPRGPIAVHTPEICYSGQGVMPMGDRAREVIDIGNEDHSFWRISLNSRRDSKTQLEAYYAWSEGSKWQAAEYPRLWLTGKLYKIQLACQPTNAGEVSDAVLFLKEFLPKLQPLLVKTS